YNSFQHTASRPFRLRAGGPSCSRSRRVREPLRRGSAGHACFNHWGDMVRTSRVRLSVALAIAAGLCLLAALPVACAKPGLVLKKGDKIVFIGNTLAEREQYFGHFETLLHGRFPEHELVVRNLGWSADELYLRPRSQSFDDHGHTLRDHKADVILAF